MTKQICLFVAGLAAGACSVATLSSGPRVSADATESTHRCDWVKITSDDIPEVEDGRVPEMTDEDLLAVSRLGYRLVAYQGGHQFFERCR